MAGTPDQQYMLMQQQPMMQQPVMVQQQPMYVNTLTQPMYMPPQQQTTTTTTITQAPAQQPQQIVVVGGGCIKCGGLSMVEEFTCCAIALAIIFFPLGFLCCLFMKQRRCLSCGHITPI